MYMKKFAIFRDSFRAQGIKELHQKCPRHCVVSAHRSFQIKRDSVPRLARGRRWIFYN
jgi:hypothetical protein